MELRRWMVILALVAACGGGGQGAEESSGDERGEVVAPADVADAARLPELPGGDGEVADLVGEDSAGPAVPGWSRPDQGEPVPAEDVAEVTALYLELLRESRYFAVTAERTHGWPRSDPADRYWYGTWWSGVRVLKEDGKVTYLHSADGADNNGMRSGPLLAGACYAQQLWGDQGDLVQELVRGFNSWARCMERPGANDQGILLARAHYPESVAADDGDGVGYYIDYSLNRPGEVLDEESPPTFYVRNPDNPHWGDIWVKNKRSKDDIGHMLHALAALPACSGAGPAGLEEDLALAADLYGRWCRRVEDDGWRIATVDEQWQLYYPEEDLAFYIEMLGTECKSMLAVRLFGRGDRGSLECGNGIGYFDEEWGLKNDFHQIQRSHHEAAASLAYLHNDAALGDELASGLAWRLDLIFDARESGEPYKGPHDEDLVELVIFSATAGVPLTSREVRFLHERIRAAHDSYLAPERYWHYRVFDPAAPDGEYPFEPGGSGIFWRDLGGVLGLCASPYAHPGSRPALDCEAVRQAGGGR